MEVTEDSAVTDFLEILEVWWRAGLVLADEGSYYL